MKLNAYLGIATTLLLAAASAGGDALTDVHELRQRADQIRHTPDLLRFLQIPWYTDLNEGIKVAKEESRPVLLWAAGDDPLGRC